MLNDSLFILAIAIALSLLARHVYAFLKARRHEEESLSQLKQLSADINQVTDWLRMLIILIAAIALAVNLLIAKDDTKYELARCVGALLIGESLGKLLRLRQTYTLRFNGQAFLYDGRLFRFDQITGVSAGRLSLQPGRIRMADGETLSIFKRGLDAMAYVIGNYARAKQSASREAAADIVSDRRVESEAESEANSAGQTNLSAQTADDESAD